MARLEDEYYQFKQFVGQLSAKGQDTMNRLIDRTFTLSSSHKNALWNVIGGGIFNCVATVLIFQVSLSFAFGATLFYAGASYLRSYLVRKFIA